MARKLQTYKAENVKGTNWDKLNPEVKHSGSHITLPEDPVKMSLDSAITHLMNKRDAENMEMSFVDFIEGFPLDAAVAFNRALANLYGWASPVPTPGFFGPTPPRMINVQVGVGEYLQVPWGQFNIPSLPTEYKLGIGVSNGPGGRPQFYIAVTMPRKFSGIFSDICDETREVLRAQSIYKGKAISLTKKPSVDNPPAFFDTSKLNRSELILNDDVEGLLEANLWNMLEYTDVCEKMRVPLKRGILVEGPYGTGKSFISAVTAQIATKPENGWTFVHVAEASILAEALEFAKFFEPCVVFCEDIDRLANLDRDDNANTLLNILDGVTSKNSKVITVLTSNHVEKIAKAMLRPGRLDAVLRIGLPDEKSRAKLIRMYARDCLDENEDITEPVAALAGQIPASIREVVERAKLFAIPRYETTGKVVIRSNDLLFVTNGMKRHMDLLAEGVNLPPIPQHQVGISISEIVTNQVTAEVTKQVTSVRENLDKFILDCGKQPKNKQAA